MSQIIKAVFTGRFCTCRRVFQWDTDDKLQLVNLDLPQNYTVDFANSLAGTSVSVLATSDTVQIPPEMFVPGSEIYAWVWISDTNGGYTKCQATIPIDPRAQKSGTSPAPAQESAWDQAVQTLNDAAADYETAISHAPIIQNGYWFIWDSTAGEYVTTDVKAEGVDGNDGENGNIIWWTTAKVLADGDYATTVRRRLNGPDGLTPAAGDYVFGPSIGTEGDPTTLYVITASAIAVTMTALGSIVGTPGQDGYSPEVTITEITGGHRVTITDEDHPQGQSFDVMDGVQGETGPVGPQGPGVTEDLRAALLQLAQKVAYIDEHGADYYQDLYDALYPSAALLSISATFTQGSTVVYENADLDSLRPMLYVEGHYDDNTDAEVTTYDLSGYLTAGTSTVTVSYRGKTTTFTVTVTEQPTLSSISAVYTQSGTVYDTDTLDSLKTDLVVTAHYSDSSTQTVPAADYTLSGTLTAGTSAITVSYGEMTDAFSVTVSYPTREMLFGTLRTQVAILRNMPTDTPPSAAYFISAPKSRAVVPTPILNRNFVITSKDTTKYEVIAFAVTSNEPRTDNVPQAAVDGIWYQSNTESIAWGTSASSNADYVWIGMRNKNNQDFTDAELANAGEAIFSYTMS